MAELSACQYLATPIVLAFRPQVYMHNFASNLKYEKSGHQIRQASFILPLHQSLAERL